MGVVTSSLCVCLVSGVIEERFLSKRREMLEAILRQGLVPIVHQVTERVERGSRRESEEVGREMAEMIVGGDVRITALREPMGILNAGEGETVKGNVKDGEGETVKGNVKDGEGEIVKGNVKDGEGETVKGNVRDGEGEIVMGNVRDGEGEIVMENEDGGEKEGTGITEAHAGIEILIAGGGAGMRENVTKREGGDEGTVMAPGGTEGPGGEGRGIPIAGDGAERGERGGMMIVVVVVGGVGEEGGMVGLEVGHGGGTETTETLLSLIGGGDLEMTGTLIEIAEEEEAGGTVKETEVSVHMIILGLSACLFRPRSTTSV